MKPEDYDKMLGSMQTPEEWSRIPPQDAAIYSVFCSVAPKVLRLNHRFVRYEQKCIQHILSTLRPLGVLDQVPPILAAQPPHHGVGQPIAVIARAWQSASSQEWLVSEYPNFKYFSGRSVLYDANLNEKDLSDLAAALGGNSLGSRSDTKEWFDIILGIIEQCGWLLIPLPEAVDVDLLVFANRISQGLVSRLESAGCTSQAEWRNQRVFFEAKPPIPVVSSIFPETADRGDPEERRQIEEAAKKLKEWGKLQPWEEDFWGN